MRNIRFLFAVAICLLLGGIASAQTSRGARSLSDAMRKRSEARKTQDVEDPESAREARRAVASTGTLRRNNARGPSEAPFALVDSEGTLKYFVSPRGDVDLDSYVGRKVSLEGKRRSGKSGAVPQMFAESVEPLAKARSRKEVIQASAQAADEEAEDSEDVFAVKPAAHKSVSSAPVVMSDEVIMDGDEVIVDEWGGPGVGRRRPIRDRVLGDYYDGPGYFCGFYARPEYLHWWTQGMNTPALVTTSTAGTTQENAGVLGQSTTSVLFGDRPINTGSRAGGRITLGTWLDTCENWGVEGDYFSLADQRTAFARTSDGANGSTILARPYFDVSPDAEQIGENSELISFPGVIRGTVNIDATNRFEGAGIFLRRPLCCTGCLDACGGQGYRYDFLIGYRYYRLDDKLFIQEDLTSIEPADTRFLINDRFDTRNQFHGASFGGMLTSQYERWSLMTICRLSLGNTRATVRINGDTRITSGSGANATTQNFSGGFLAQSTNSGVFRYDDFAVVPEVGINIGYQLTPVWKAVAGYTFIYWSRVYRAGDQIDRHINTNLLPGGDTAATGPSRPSFRFVPDDFWAQGVNVGLQGNW